MLEKLKPVMSQICRFDTVIFAVILAVVLFMLGKAVTVIIALTYIYTALYYVLSKIIKRKGFIIAEIFALFVPVLIIIISILNFIRDTGAEV
jgi:hypothetical protein